MIVKLQRMQSILEINLMVLGILNAHIIKMETLHQKVEEKKATVTDDQQLYHNNTRGLGLGFHN